MRAIGPGLRRSGWGPGATRAAAQMSSMSLVHRSPGGGRVAEALAPEFDEAAQARLAHAALRVREQTGSWLDGQDQALALLRETVIHEHYRAGVAHRQRHGAIQNAYVAGTSNTLAQAEARLGETMDAAPANRRGPSLAIAGGSWLDVLRQLTGVGVGPTRQQSDVAFLHGAQDPGRTRVTAHSQGAMSMHSSTGDLAPLYPALRRTQLVAYGSPLPDVSGENATRHTGTRDIIRLVRPFTGLLYGIFRSGPQHWVTGGTHEATDYTRAALKARKAARGGPHGKD